MIGEFKAQAAIEYMITYGWMVMAVAVIGGGIYGVAGGDTELTDLSDIGNSDIEIANYGLSSNNLSLEIQSIVSKEVGINSIRIEDPETGLSTRVLPSGTIPEGESEVYSLRGVETAELENEFDIEINYRKGVFDELEIEDEGGLDMTISENASVGEAGSVTGLGGNEWHSGAFSYSFAEKPIMFVTTQTTDGGQDPSSAHLRNINTTFFETQHCEYHTADSCQGHNDEENAYLAFQRSELNSVSGIESGLLNVSGTGYYNIDFRKMQEDPLVFVQSQTSNGDPTFNVRVTGSGPAGANIRFCEQETSDGCGSGATEEIAWMAIDPSKVEETDGFEYGSIETSDGDWQSVSFDKSFTDPVVIATVMTEDYPEEAMYAEVDDVTQSGADVRFCESDGGDGCDSHGQEKVSWLAVEKGEIVISRK